MIHGTASVRRVVEESTCRSSEDYRFTDIGVYKIHSTSLMPIIPFEKASVYKEDIDDSIFLGQKNDIDIIDDSIFVNDKQTKPYFEKFIYCQNFLSTRYVGRAPLEYYTVDDYTLMGREFLLICREGVPTADYRVFGTEDAIRGYNRNANENIKLPGGGD